MRNLLDETRAAIADSGHTPADVVFIGSEESGHACTWDEFCLLADREYEEGFGAAEVADDLVIVFRDGAKMWRGEYDGSEWWEYSTPFDPPAEHHTIETLFAGDRGAVGWVSLKELHERRP
jgi:hypothetical protein